MSLFDVRVVLVGLALGLFSGCNLGMHWVSDPAQNRVIKASSGDRFFFKLPAGGVDSLRWSAKSDDPDVTVKIDRHETEDAVSIRVHRGFDGPATVVFHARKKSGQPPDDFTILVYKRTGDEAFWE